MALNQAGFVTGTLPLAGYGTTLLTLRRPKPVDLSASWLRIACIVATAAMPSGGGGRAAAATASGGGQRGHVGLHSGVAAAFPKEAASSRPSCIVATAARPGGGGAAKRVKVHTGPPFCDALGAALGSWTPSSKHQHLRVALASRSVPVPENMLRLRYNFPVAFWRGSKRSSKEVR